MKNKTSRTVTPPPAEQSTGGNGEKISVSSSCSTGECSRAGGAKELSEKEITRKRHALFENFADFAIGHLSDDPALACKAAETALKALSTGEHDHPPGDNALKMPALSKFTEDLERAYAAE